MNPYLEKLKAYIKANLPNFGDGESVLSMLYECYNENNPYDNEQIRADFNELYRQMNGMPLREMDQIVYPVCRLCRDHEQASLKEFAWAFSWRMSWERWSYERDCYSTECLHPKPPIRCRRQRLRDCPGAVISSLYSIP